MSQTISITIDKKKIVAHEGQTIMEAADAAGVYIPRLCYHKDLLPGGHCRVCTVRIDGRPVSACSHPVADLMTVENESEGLNAMRKQIIEMLFVEGNHTCPSCETSGSCELQALGYRLGLVAPTLPYVNKPRELDASHPDVFADRDRCVLCGRCVRASNQVDGKSVFGFEERGSEQRITVNAPVCLADTNLAATDKAVEVCPTGCLVRKREGFNIPVGQRPYDHEPIGSDITATDSDSALQEV